MGTINSLIIHQEFIYDRRTLSAETPTMSIILNIKTIALTIFFTSSSLATTIQPSNQKEKMEIKVLHCMETLIHTITTT